jgi:hypothetical protein
MDYKGVLGNASRLKKNSLYKVTIAEATREILLQLNTTVMNAHDAGMSRIEMRIPVNFRSIDESVSNEELQTAIYYNVVMDLEQKGYEVRLCFRKEFTLMKVCWAVKADNSEIKKMRQKLMEIRAKDSSF